MGEQKQKKKNPPTTPSTVWFGWLGVQLGLQGPRSKSSWTPQPQICSHKASLVSSSSSECLLVLENNFRFAPLGQQGAGGFPQICSCSW